MRVNYILIFKFLRFIIFYIKKLIDFIYIKLDEKITLMQLENDMNDWVK